MAEWTPTAPDVAEATDAVRAYGGRPPAVALILGTGLGALADEIAAPIEVSYSAIPHFPVSTVVGHTGTLVLGSLQGVPVVAMRGRAHFYEGYTLREVTLPVRLMRRLGARTLLVTNAAGAVNETFRAGDLMLLTDHLNLPGLAGHNPLVGPHEPELGVRFLDMSAAYDADLRAAAHDVAREAGFAVRQGVYAMIAGPTFESPAEIRFLRLAGADAVGMSTVPEVVVARHEGMRVLGVSVITNMASGALAAADELTHQDVLATAAVATPRLLTLARGVVASLRAKPQA